MALSVKNLTHARSEVRGVCESSPHGEVHIFALRMGCPLTVCPYASSFPSVNSYAFQSAEYSGYGPDYKIARLQSKKSPESFLPFGEVRGPLRHIDCRIPRIGYSVWSVVRRGGRKSETRGQI